MNTIKTRKPSAPSFWRKLGLCAAALIAPCANASNDQSIQLHGFASQAYLYSQGNNFFGDSSDSDGSFEYFEAAIGGQYRLNSWLSVSGQLFSRDAGATDNGSIRTDYLYADVRFVQNLNSAAGIRIGRVRNPYGFYNSTRDVLFTRPSILLPQSYYEGFGIRELFFSSDGLQLYGYWDGDNHSTTFTSTYGRTDDISSSTFSTLFGSSSFAGKAEHTKPAFAQLMSEINGGLWKVGVSMYDGSLNFSTPRFTAGLEANIVALSLQRNFQYISVTGEYSLLSLRGAFASPFIGVQRFSSKGESLYVQTDYRQNSQLTWFARVDNQLGDRTRPNATDSLAVTLGGRWTPAKNWLLAAEVHGLRGTAAVPRADNRGRIIDERSEVFVMMLGYKF